MLIEICIQIDQDNKKTKNMMLIFFVGFYHYGFL